MGNAMLLSSAYGWFVGLLIVMIVVTALFAFILWIALKPIKKDELDDSSSARKALARRETELTVALLKLLNKESDEGKRAELENKLREVKAAEKLVNELMGEDEPAAKPAKPVKPVKPAPKAAKPAAAPVQQAAKPAKPAAQPAAKPAAAPVQQAVKPAKPAAQPAAKPAAAPAQQAAKPAAKPAPAKPAEEPKKE